MTVALRLMVTLMDVILSGKWLAVLRKKKKRQLIDDEKNNSQGSTAPEVDGHKSQPDDARRVHCDSDVL